MMWSNASTAVNALYNSQVVASQTAAIAAGVAEAQAIITMRSNDGYNRASPYPGAQACPIVYTHGRGLRLTRLDTCTDPPYLCILGSTACGKWRTSPPPSLQTPAAPGWRYVTPWAMETPSQFRLPPPPNYLTSDIYQKAYIEVMQYGRKDSTVRTAEQTMTADFWHLNVQWYTNELTRKVSKARTRCGNPCSLGQDTARNQTTFPLLAIHLCTDSCRPTTTSSRALAISWPMPSPSPTCRSRAGTPSTSTGSGGPSRPFGTAVGACVGLWVFRCSRPVFS